MLLSYIYATRQPLLSTRAHNIIMQPTKTIRVSLDVYNKLCELGKTNDSFTEVVDRLFKDNNLLPIVTDEELKE